MKIAILHSAAGGFFPRFYLALHHSINKSGNNCVLLLPNIATNRRSDLPDKKIWGSRLNTFVHRILYRVSGLQDIFSFFDTLCLLYYLYRYQPDVIHCHILNDQYLNLPLFAFYVNRKQIPVVWTMHDCRAITGRCAYFDEIGCNRWLSGCGSCPQKVLYSPTVIDGSHFEWIIRRNIMSRIKKLTIVCPSEWLAEILSRSFMSDFRCVVINNGIDIDLFAAGTSIRSQYHIAEDKKVILGIASAWEDRKGLSAFVQLAQDLSEEYVIVLVGNLPKDDRQLPPNVVSIPPTADATLLASIYHSADIFVNPTIADNFPTTNIESLASGTPLVTYRTGGSAECLDVDCGLSVTKGDYLGLKNAIVEVINNPTRFSSKRCQARATRYSMAQYDRYVDLYKSLVI